MAISSHSVSVCSSDDSSSCSKALDDVSSLKAEVSSSPLCPANFPTKTTTIRHPNKSSTYSKAGMYFLQLIFSFIPSTLCSMPLPLKHPSFPLPAPLCFQNQAPISRTTHRHMPAKFSGIWRSGLPLHHFIYTNSPIRTNTHSISAALP